MDIFQQISDAIHDFLVNLVGGVFIQIFNEANEQTGQIASQVSLSPSDWNSGIFTMIRNLSNNVILPIAGMIITFVLCYELITAITERNNMRDVDVDTFIKYIFKAPIPAVLSSNLKKQRRKRKPVTLHERLSVSSSAKRLRKRLKQQRALFRKLPSSQKRSFPVWFTR